MHVRRVERHGSPFVVLPRGKPATVCSLPGCGAKHFGKGWCQRHYMQVRRGQEPTLERPGDFVTYSGAHRRVYYVKGPAKLHSCVECGGRALDWAYVGGDPNEIVGPVPRPKSHNRPPSMCAYSADPEFYVPMCRRCHVAHDRKPRTIPPTS